MQQVADTVASTGPGLQTIANWTGAVGSLVGGLAGAAAAIAAFKTVSIAIEGRRTENQYRYYRSLVFEPADAALDNFREESRAIIRQTVAQIERLRGQNEGSQVVISTVREGNGELVESWDRLNDTVMTGLRAWDDSELTNSVRQQLERLQDEFTREMQRLPSRPEPDPSDVYEAIRRNRSNVLGTIMSRDPGMKRTESHQDAVSD